MKELLVNLVLALGVLFLPIGLAVVLILAGSTALAASSRSKKPDEVSGWFVAALAFATLVAAFIVFPSFNTTYQECTAMKQQVASASSILTVFPTIANELRSSSISQQYATEKCDDVLRIPWPS